MATDTTGVFRTTFVRAKPWIQLVHEANPLRTKRCCASAALFFLDKVRCFGLTLVISELTAYEFVNKVVQLGGYALDARPGRGAAFGMSDDRYDAIALAVVVVEKDRRLSELSKRHSEDMRRLWDKNGKLKESLSSLRNKTLALENENCRLVSDSLDASRSKKKEATSHGKVKVECDKLHRERDILQKALKAKEKRKCELEKQLKSMLQTQKTLCAKLSARLEVKEEELQVLKSIVADSISNEISLRHDLAKAQKSSKEKEKLVQSTKKEKKASLQKMKAEMDALGRRMTKLSDRSKNRGRALKKLRGKMETMVEEAKDCVELLGVKRNLKPMATLSERQKRRRTKQIKETLATVTRKVLDAYKVNIEGYGDMAFKLDVTEDDVLITAMKGSTVHDQVKAFLRVHDEGLSMKKIQKVHSINPWAAPSAKDIRMLKNKRNEEIMSDILDIEYDEDSFHVFPKKTLLYLAKKRNLKFPNNRCDLTLEGDGRGTGNSVNTVKLQFRLFEEGRKTFQKNRSYLLCLLTGCENRKGMPKLMKKTLDACRKLQEEGFEYEGRHIRVHWHLLADGKFIQLCCGTCRFCLEDHNCTMCLSKPSEREDPTVRWAIEYDRYEYCIGDYGIVDTDLFDFIPLERRWPEGMHTAIRFAGDKLIKSAFTEIITLEMKKEGAGLRAIEDEMRRIGFKSFAFKAAKSKDPSAVGAYTYRTLSYVDLVKVAEEFEFAPMFKKNPAKGMRMQHVLRDWIRFFRLTYCNYPGDGPVVSADEMFAAHSQLYSALISGGDEEPGESEDDGEDDPASWPTKLIHTYYAHAFHSHVPELYQRSRQYAHYFQDPELLEPIENTGGGLKFFRTDSLERSNLHFFHNYFQTNPRRKKEYIIAAGFNEVRGMTDDDDKAKHHCVHCGKAYQYWKRYEDHEADCKQAPIFDVVTSYSCLHLDGEMRA